MTTGPDAADLATRLRRLEDIEELRLLKARYFAAVDGRDWVGLRSVFADDCTFVGSPNRPAITGAEEFVTYVRGRVDPGRSTHLGFMPRFEFVGADEATATWSMYDRVERVGRPGWFGFGTYVERCRRLTDGRWAVVAWRLDRDAPVQPLPPLGGSADRSESQRQC